jgi:predicted N-acetyltransferase YhbS
MLVPDSSHYDPQVEALYAHAFGPGRFAKAASRLREGNRCVRDYCVVALDQEVVVGACRLWPIIVGQAGQALFLGPIAVDPMRRSSGLGKSLVEACLQAIAGAGDPRPIILVGDLAFFASFGFVRVPAGDIVLPGPVDPARLLWRRSDSANAALKGRLSVPRATSLQG